MANILVYIEARGERPIQASLEALGLARRIATRLGATVYALLPCATRPLYQDNDIIDVLSRGGADKVLLVTHPAFGEHVRGTAHGKAVGVACDTFYPALVLFPATNAGRELAPRCAAKLAAAYMPEATVELGTDGSLVLRRAAYAGKYVRVLRAEDLECPIVVTVPEGRYKEAQGNEEAEVVVLSASPEEESIAQIREEPASRGPLDTARVVVTAGAGLGADALQVAHLFAEAFGGEAALTRAAAAGLSSQHAERVVDASERRIAPRLYIACAASGSLFHLGAVDADTVVAINNDARAPIFQIARYGIISDAREAARALAALLAKRS